MVGCCLHPCIGFYMISQRVDHRDHRLCSRTQSRFAATQTHCAAASRPFWLRRVSAVSNGRNHKPGSDYCQEDPRNDGQRNTLRSCYFGVVFWPESDSKEYAYLPVSGGESPIIESLYTPTCPPRGLLRSFRDHSFSFRGMISVNWICFRGASGDRTISFRLIPQAFTAIFVHVGFTSAGPS